MLKNYPLLLVLLFNLNLWSQEIQIFKVQDFDLKGNVKSCLVITNYGKEQFEFNQDGFLTKTITQYNDTDQDITYYKYSNGVLLEKRMESYKGNVLDAATSMVNFYSVDTTNQKKIFEKIISYDKEFLEQQEYIYNEKDRLTKIVTSNAGGVDETTLDYVTVKNETTTSYYINGIVEKSIRISERKKANKSQKVVLTKEYIDGDPHMATEEVFDMDGKLISKEIFIYNLEKKAFDSEKKLFHFYDLEGMLTKVITKTKTSEAFKEYIFQFDNSEEKNWVKQIITPENTYTTRKISYYPAGMNQEAPN
ncbi:hypothetical protein [Flagellimonas eckloniae]|uniref:Uncharacterized protein n=1 Tax=Flagellimonas eckloniae TaxID=346185 RepID=A0A0Q0XDQ1_9FLAO|nr:hypothetical protein [Allomuricauda eckloniae]KQC29281.1 hypothetical protein AAY42_04695 [Allomuricauda eckloniae]